MFNLFKSKSTKDASDSAQEAAPVDVDNNDAHLFSRLQQGLARTSQAITGNIQSLFTGSVIDEDALEDLEDNLLMADVGIDATQKIISTLRESAKRQRISNQQDALQVMFDQMAHILRPISKPLLIDESKHPMVILMVGINGAGKTTTIGKLAKQLQARGKSVMLAAGDTFRAAAVEQLKVWGERNDVHVVAQGTGADSASVIYDAIESAKAKGVDVVIADTAGRLHTQSNLMSELEKVQRVIGKLDESAPHEVMLVIDASIGQNALVQAREFDQALNITGITVTKLDGTAKGGILFALAEQLKIPVRFIGVGEAIGDLQQFDGYEFSSALLMGESQK